MRDDMLEEPWTSVAGSSNGGGGGVEVYCGSQWSYGTRVLFALGVCRLRGKLVVDQGTERSCPHEVISPSLHLLKKTKLLKHRHTAQPARHHVSLRKKLRIRACALT
jgi:hypothetical protein